MVEKSSQSTSSQSESFLKSSSVDWNKGLSSSTSSVFKQISCKLPYICAISTDNRLWRRKVSNVTSDSDSDNWTCIQQEKMSDVSVGKDGTVIALSESEGYPYIWNTEHNNMLQLENPMRMKQVSVGDHRTIWGLREDGSTWKYFEREKVWKQMAMGNVHHIKYLSCANDQTCWAIDRNGDTVEWESDQWKLRSRDMKFRDISVAGYGAVFAVSDNGEVFQWNKSGEHWAKCAKQAPSHLRNITAVDENHWIGINENGRIESL